MKALLVDDVLKMKPADIATRDMYPKDVDGLYIVDDGAIYSLATVDGNNVYLAPLARDRVVLEDAPEDKEDALVVAKLSEMIDLLGEEGQDSKVQYNSLSTKLELLLQGLTKMSKKKAEAPVVVTANVTQELFLKTLAVMQDPSIVKGL